MKSFLLAQAGNINRATDAAATGADKASQSEFVKSVLSSFNVFTNVLISLLIMVGFYILGKLLARRLVKTLREAKGESLYPDMVALVNRFTVYGSVLVGLAVVIQFVFDLDFIQVLGFFGLGISFAFKDLLANLIAGAVIIIQNRFRIGDFIQVGKDGIRGKIMEIQTRATILKAIDGTEIVIPNAELMIKPVISYTAHSSRRIDFVIGISFGADIDKAIEVAKKVMGQHEYVLENPPPHVIVAKVGESSVELSMRFYIDPKNKEKSWIETKSELTAQVKQAFDREGIEIPFPIRTLKGAIGVAQESGEKAPATAPEDPLPDLDEDMPDEV